MKRFSLASQEVDTLAIIQEFSTSEELVKRYIVPLGFVRQKF